MAPSALAFSDARATARGRTGNHDLAGRIEVGRAHDFALARVTAGGVHRLFAEPEDRRHRARPDRHGFLHVAAAMTDQPDRIGELERPCRDMCGVLAEAVAGDHRRFEAAGREQAVRRHAHGQDRRLSVLRQREAIGRTVEDEVAQRLSERRIRLVEHLAAFRESVDQGFAHADDLRSLAGKDECNHRSFTASEAISCSTRASTLLLTNRDAIATAFRTALTEERPWPTMQSPATPISGAPPYSE